LKKSLFCHISHVAGIAAGNGAYSGGIYAGIAPRADIIAVKILDNKGLGSYKSAAEGIFWAVKNAESFNIKVLNLSVGAEDSFVPDFLDRAVREARKKGIIVLAAKNPPSQGGRVISPFALGVGCSEDYAGKLPAGYMRGRSFTLAHGKNVISCMARDFVFSGGTRSHDKIAAPGYIKMSGSSMATPKIAGLCARLISEEQNLLPSQIIKMILGNDPFYAAKIFGV